jgi:hypothetical protein
MFFIFSNLYKFFLKPPFQSLCSQNFRKFRDRSITCSRLELWIQHDAEGRTRSNFTRRHAPRSAVCKYVQNVREHFIGRYSSAREYLL